MTYRPVPPTSSGSRPRSPTAVTTGRAAASQSATVKRASGATRSTQVVRDGGARRGIGLGGSDIHAPIHLPRVGDEDLDAAARAATAIARSVLPDAVGPTMAQDRRRRRRRPHRSSRPRRAAGPARSRCPAGRAIGLDQHGVEAHRPRATSKRVGRWLQEARQDGLDREADDRVARPGHADVADVGRPLRQQPCIGGGDVGVGADDRGHPAVEVPAHRVLLGGDLAVEVDDAEPAAAARRPRRAGCPWPRTASRAGS